MRSLDRNRLLLACCLLLGLAGSAAADPARTVPVLLNGVRQQATVIGDVTHRGDGTVCVRGTIGCQTRLGYLGAMFNPARLAGSSLAEMKVLVGTGRPAIGLKVGKRIYLVDAYDPSRSALVSALGATRSKPSPFASIYYTRDPGFAATRTLTYSPSAQAFVLGARDAARSPYYLSIVDSASDAGE